MAQTTLEFNSLKLFDSSANPEHGKGGVQGDGKLLHNTNESGLEIRKSTKKC